MGHLRGSLLAALLCMHLASAADYDPFDSQLRCVTPPTWTSGEVNPMLQGRGKVTVVALLQASWSFCLSQASKLEELRLELVEDGLDDVNFMVINSGGWLSRMLSSRLHSRVSFPVYEEGYLTSIWETLNGAKDDMLVYDRCGYLTYHLRMPYSFLDWPHVGMAIRSTHYGTDPCNCTLPVAVWNTPSMQENTTSSVENTSSSVENTNSSVENTNSTAGNNTMVGNNTEEKNNTMVENVEALALNSTTNSSSGVELDVPSTGVKEETNKANKTKERENAHKKRYRHLVKHHSHHDENFARVKWHDVVGHDVATCRELRENGIKDTWCWCWAGTRLPGKQTIADDGETRPEEDNQVCGSWCWSNTTAYRGLEEQETVDEPCASWSKVRVVMTRRAWQSWSTDPAVAEFCGEGAR